LAAPIVGILVWYEGMGMVYELINDM